MKLLCLSNGHGEDGIACRILRELRSLANHKASGIEDIVALPLVGEGHAYREAGIPIIGQVKAMPSGGFVYMDGRQLARDLGGGLLALTQAQIQTVRAWGKGGGQILAVGDIVPLLFAWISGAPYGFVGTAKSDYYLRDETGPLVRQTRFERFEGWAGSDYLPWERWLMGHRRCRAVFPRDRLTAENLRQWPLPVFDLGNPMMDGLGEAADQESEHTRWAWESGELTWALMPGSRPPEAYANWGVILRGVQAWVEQWPHPLRFVGAIAPSLPLDMFQQPLIQAGWQPTADPHTFCQRHNQLCLRSTGFADTLQQAQGAIAMAGTATEQMVGLGKPVITYPGNGPQFTPAFAEAQTRLLGCSVWLCDRPTETPEIIKTWQTHPEQRQHIATNGQRRMGRPGAAARIAQTLVTHLGSASPKP